MGPSPEKSLATPAAAAPSMPPSHARWHNTVRTRPSFDGASKDKAEAVAAETRASGQRDSVNHS
jgi:hypothetical protein